MQWIDRFIAPPMLEKRTDALRARAIVGASFFATVASLTAQGIRLQQESQHWIALLAWTVCTFLFIITPVVALVQPDFTLTPNAYEVADVFEVPLEFLMNPAHHQRHVFEWEGVRREWFSMPYQDDTAQRFIWGATAGMLRNFYRLLVAT